VWILWKTGASAGKIGPFAVKNAVDHDGIIQPFLLIFHAGRRNSFFSARRSKEKKSFFSIASRDHPFFFHENTRFFPVFPCFHSL
jgi:hypothetical protein